MEKKTFPAGKVLDKLQRYCAYQDRCMYDVRKKIAEYDLTAQDKEWVMEMLAEEHFVDDGRFARSFVRGKGLGKGWGKIRIERQLKMRGISPSIIREAMGEINDDDYKEHFKRVCEDKIRSVGGVDSYEKKARVYNYLLSKGYPSEMIMEVLNVK